MYYKDLYSIESHIIHTDVNRDKYFHSYMLEQRRYIIR
jgi:hypothetical protein